MEATVTSPRRTTTHPVVEIFGPTIQGEGSEAGLPCYFVRFGGCDFRCTWCDTMYAVDPAEVRANAQRLTDSEVAEAIDGLGGAADWVVLSGGNPALHEFDGLVSTFHDRDLRVAVETQGSVWRDWLARVDRLTVSPKPPSSGMATERHAAQFERFMERASDLHELVLKVVCFDEVDLDWAKQVHGRHPGRPFFLSAGTPVPTPPNLLGAVADRFRWLCERVAADADLSAAKVLPQLHVIAWGDARGV